MFLSNGVLKTEKLLGKKIVFLFKKKEERKKEIESHVNNKDVEEKLKENR